MDANPANDSAQNIVYTPNYVLPYTPDFSQYPALPIQPYIGYYSRSSNIRAEDCDTSNPCTVTQSDTTDLTNGLAVSISVSIKFDIASVGIIFHQRKISMV